MKKEIATEEAEELFNVLDMIVFEFESDPMSVQCFDLRVVQRAKDIIAKLKKT